MIAIFEKRPAGYLSTIDRMMRDGRLTVLYLRPLDLSVDETLQERREALARTGAKRVVIDSLSGFEMAVSPGFREDFREFLYRLVGVLTNLGVTVMMTLEIEDTYTELRLGPRENAFLTDAIIPAVPRARRNAPAGRDCHQGPRQRSQQGLAPV